MRLFDNKNTKQDQLREIAELGRVAAAFGDRVADPRLFAVLHGVQSVARTADQLYKYSSENNGLKEDRCDVGFEVN